MADRDKCIPAEGVEKAALLERMRALRGGDIPWQEHKAFGLVFHQSDEHTELLKEAYTLFFSENALNPMAFESLRAMEHEVVRMTANLLGGDRETVGVMTSGGTESIMLAVRTYRDRARKKKPWIRRPEIVMPVSGHVAYDKAGEYFDVKIVHTPVGDDFRADVRQIARRINRNTIALVGSAPSFPQGVIDPIEELAALAQQRGIGLHVDACIGGFFLPWLEKAGYDVPPFDFRVPGVTSMSADIHKYGYAAKGASTILYRSMEYLHHQIYVYVDWPGGIYASPSMPGTRPGGTIAAAWASLHAMGQDGFVRNAKEVMETTKQFIEGINAIDELEVLGRPAMCVFAFRTKEKRINCFAVADYLQRKGWHIDRQQRPECLHLMINPGHAQMADAFLADLGEAVAYVKAHPEAAVEGSAPTYGLMTKAPLRGMVKRNVLAIMEAMYSADGEAPNLGNISDDEDETEAPPPPGVPRVLLQAMKLKARLGRLLGRG